MKKLQNSRFSIGVVVALMVAGTLTLGLANAEAADWHYGWSAWMAIPEGDGYVDYEPCPFVLPSGVPSHTGRVGAHHQGPSSSHGWAMLRDDWDFEYIQYGQSLGYSPGIKVLAYCASNPNGPSEWFESDFYDLWEDYVVGNGAEGPNWYCPKQPYIAAFCETRAWW